MKLYAVVLSGQKVYYNESKEQVKKFMLDNKYKLDEKVIFDFDISNDVAAKIKYLNPRFEVYPFVNPSVEFLNKVTVKSENYLKKNNISEVGAALLFLNDGQLVWSPSINNLNVFYNRDSSSYLEKPQRVIFNKETYMYMSAVFEYECDSF